MGYFSDTKGFKKAFSNMCDEILESMKVLDSDFIRQNSCEYLFIGKKEKAVEILNKFKSIFINVENINNYLNYLNHLHDRNIIVIEFLIPFNNKMELYVRKYVGTNPEQSSENFKYTKEALKIDEIFKNNKNIELEYKMRSDPTLDWSKEIVDKWR